MDDLPNPRLEAAKAIYARFARISDPETIERRWNRLPPLQQERWLDEANAAVDTFLRYNEVFP